MRMRESMKRTGLYMAIAFLMATAVCWSLLSAASPLLGRACDMAVVPNTNVNLATNIRDVLNAAGGNATDDVLTFFYPANLNEFSKYKPVTNTKVFDLTDADFKESDWGYHIPDGVGLTTLMGYYVQSTPPSVWIPTNNKDVIIAQGWWYEVPKGGVASPYRLSDFRGYNSSSIGPLFRLNLTTQDLTTQSTVFSAYLTFPLGLSLTDFGSLNGSHLGIFCVKDGATSGRYTCIPDNRFTEPTIYLDNTAINKFFPTTGTYKVYAFATTARYQNYDSSGDSYMGNPNAVLAYPLPIPAVTVSISTPTATRYFDFAIGTLSVTKSGVVYQLNMSVTAKNIGSQSRTFIGSNMKVRVRYYNERVDITEDDRTVTTTSVNISAGATSTVYSGTFGTQIHHNAIIPVYVNVDILYPDSSGTYRTEASRTIYYDGGPSIEA